MWGEENMDAFPDRELVHDQSWGRGEPFPLSDAEKGIRKPQDDSSALAWPLDRGKPLEIKVKAPRCCLEARASERLLTRLEPENEGGSCWRSFS